MVDPIVFMFFLKPIFLYLSNYKYINLFQLLSLRSPAPLNELGNVDVSMTKTIKSFNVSMMMTCSFIYNIDTTVQSFEYGNIMLVIKCNTTS